MNVWSTIQKTVEKKLLARCFINTVPAKLSVLSDFLLAFASLSNWDISNKSINNAVALKRQSECRLGAHGAEATCEREGCGAARERSRWCQWCFKWPRYHSCIKHTGLQSALSPRASLCAIRLPLNSSKLAVGFFTLCLWRARGELRSYFFPVLF